MDIETARQLCLSYPCSEESFPFDETTWTAKVGGRMFAVMPLEKADMLILKCDPEKAIELTELYADIEPAWHFNKRYWIMIRFGGDVPDRLIASLIGHSYQEVVKKLTKKLRAELGLEQFLNDAQQ